MIWYLYHTYYAHVNWSWSAHIIFINKMIHFFNVNVIFYPFSSFSKWDLEPAYDIFTLCMPSPLCFRCLWWHHLWSICYFFAIWHPRVFECCVLWILFKSWTTITCISSKSKLHPIHHLCKLMVRYDEQDCSVNLIK